MTTIIINKWIRVLFFFYTAGIAIFSPFFVQAGSLTVTEEGQKIEISNLMGDDVVLNKFINKHRGQFLEVVDGLQLSNNSDESAPKSGSGLIIFLPPDALHSDFSGMEIGDSASNDSANSGTYYAYPFVWHVPDTSDEDWTRDDIWEAIKGTFIGVVIGCIVSQTVISYIMRKDSERNFY